MAYDFIEEDNMYASESRDREILTRHQYHDHDSLHGNCGPRTWANKLILKNLNLDK